MKKQFMDNEKVINVALIKKPSGKVFPRGFIVSVYYQIGKQFF